jgi:Nickel responsive protein SCO4226-like
VPTYLDIHDLPGVKRDAVAEAHAADLRVQDQYGVSYRRYWVDEEAGKVFCLVDAPDPVAAARVHREAHGLEAQTIHLVEEGG